MPAWQPVARRMDRAFGRPDSGGSGLLRSVWKSPPRTTAAGALLQRELAAAAHRGCLPEIHENVRAAAKLDWPPRTALRCRRLHTARILLIHHYRRVVLRDPLLPTALLPPDWPGQAARRLCGEIYRGLLPASEQWLDRYGTNEAVRLAEGWPGVGRLVRQLAIMLQK